MLWAEDVQNIWNIIAKTPVLYSIAHFIISVLVSVFAYKLYDSGLGYSLHCQTLEKLLALDRRLTQPSSSQKKSNKTFLGKACGGLFSYAIITGAASASIIEVQFSGGAHVPWAILYGLLGPYALRDMLLSFLGKKQESETKNVTSTIFEMMERAFEDKEFSQLLSGMIEGEIVTKNMNDIDVENAAEAESFQDRLNELINQFMEGSDNGGQNS